MRGDQEPERLGRGANQAGFSLLEALVSVALVSTVLLALSAGLLASVRSSQVANETQKIDAALSAYSETVKAVPLDQCPKTEEPITPTVPGYTGVISKSQSWKTDDGSWMPCGDGDPAPYRSTVTVTDDTDASNAVVGQVVVGQP